MMIRLMLILNSILMTGGTIEHSEGWYTPRQEIEMIYIQEELTPIEVIKEEKTPICYKTIKQLAQDKINDLVRTGYWSHTNSNGCDFNCRTKEYTDYGGYLWIGENLYKGKCSVSNAYRLWRNSPEHNFVLGHIANEEVLLSGNAGNGDCYYVLIRAIKK